MGRGGCPLCTDDQLKSILEQVAVRAKEVLRDRLRGAYLYGSYARGDYDAESDQEGIPFWTPDGNERTS